jgi:hypothetical protein
MKRRIPAAALRTLWPDALFLMLWKTAPLLSWWNENIERENVARATTLGRQAFFACRKV